jgi:hypothetical protein
MRVESGIPVSIGRDSGSAVRWQRLDLADRTFGEDWLQNLVFGEPAVLPINEIDPAFGPLIPIGREVETTAGLIDALYISAEGAITVVEAKLWRNPQARREVVGQIIDYATALAEWGYEELDEATRARSGSSLWEQVRSTTSLASEASFVDAVARNLSKGRFLLCVVGDGIREEVERMARYVQAAPQLQFTLALVELRVFTNPDESTWLIVPSVVARSEEVIRAVVDVELAPAGKVAVAVSVPAEEVTDSRQRLTADQFFGELADAVPPDIVSFARDFKLEFESDPRYAVDMKSSSYVIRLRGPKAGTHLSLLVVHRAGYAYMGWLGQQLGRLGVPESLGYQLVRDIAALAGVPVNPTDPQSLNKTIPLTILKRERESVRERFDRFAAEVEDSLDALD